MYNNKLLFEECLKNPSKNVDMVARETLNKIIIPIDNDTPSELLIKNSELVDLIISFNNEKETRKLDKLIEKIDECLKYEGMNYCPFSQYLMVHDVTYDMYLKKLTLEEKKDILHYYIEDRHQLYLNRDYSDIIFQVLTDSYSHKRKGAMGVKKLTKIFSNLNISRIKEDNQIENKVYYILPDSGDNKIFNKIIEKNHIDFEFKNTHQGKMPDALIKINNRFVIIEHKILKESGGGQDKQMTEIIEFIGSSERGVHYISFMDGIFFNRLINPSENNKLFRHKKHIISNLNKCPFNYFVNEYGFNEILSDIFKEELE